MSLLKEMVFQVGEVVVVNFVSVVIVVVLLVMVVVVVAPAVIVGRAIER